MTITITDSKDLSRVLFLSDLYGLALGVPGGILHVGATESDTELWQRLRLLYEPSQTRNLFVVTGKQMEDGIVLFEDSPTPVMALVYLNVSEGKTAEWILKLVAPRLTRGSVLAFSNLDDVDGQAAAVMEVFGLGNLALQRWHFSRPDCYAIV